MLSIREGNVYIIICILNPKIKYVGSTFNQVRHRWQQHKSRFEKGHRSCSIYKYFEEYGIENFQMKLLKKYQVYSEHNKDWTHLRVYEQLWINKLKCVNQHNVLTFDFMERIQKKEYKKEYILENAEKLSEYRKQYNKANAEKNSERRKKYREQNKEKFAEWRKKYREQNKEKIAEREKKYREQNKEKIAEREKKYREQNKEKISERKKKYREQNKEKIAEYGKKYREQNKEKFAEYGKKYREQTKKG